MDATQWDDRYSEADLVWSAGPNQFVEDYCANLTPGRSLDMASGEGRNALWLAEQGWTSEAVDFSPVAIEKMSQIAAQRGVLVRGMVGDLSNYVPEPGAYDLVVMAYFHVDPEVWAHAVAVSAAGLAPGGRLLIIGHDRSNIAEGVGGPQDPAILTTPSETAELLKGVLKVERAEVVDRMVEVEGSMVAAKDTYISARRSA